MDNLRTAKFQRNKLLENLLCQLNTDLQPAEAILRSQYCSATMQYPLILIMGPLRSGTTLLTQWLANTGQTDKAIDFFWRPFLVSALNEEIEFIIIKGGCYLTFLFVKSLAE